MNTQLRRLGELVAAALRQMLDPSPPREPLPPLPAWDGGRSLVDVADREALYEAMDEP